MLDRFAIETPGVAGPADSPVHLRPEWRKAPPAARPLRVVDRAGVDLHPIDAGASGRCAAPDVLPLARSARPHGDDARRDRHGARRPDEGDAAPGWTRRLAVPQASGAFTWSTRQSPGNIFPPKRSGPAPGPSRGRARARPPTPRSPMSRFEADGRRDGAALTVRLWPHAPEPDTPCAGRFSRPLGRLARLAIALRRRLLAWPGWKFGAIRGILDAVRDGYVH
jgi:hypothetical protein